MSVIMMMITIMMMIAVMEYCISIGGSKEGKVMLSVMWGNRAP